MNESSIIAVSSLIYTILLMIVYFYKKRLSRLENKIYISIMVTTFISIILFLITFIFADILLKFEHFNSVLLRLYLVSLSLWITIFTIYTYATTKIKETNHGTVSLILNKNELDFLEQNHIHYKKNGIYYVVNSDEVKALFCN